MATFAELLADVYTLTNRPDLVSETKLAVKAATLKAHHTDYYPKDMHEVAITWDPIAYVQSLDYRAIVPKWRAFKYLRKYDATGDGEATTFFTLLTPEQTLDSYSINRDNICYLAGDSLEIRSSTQDTYMILGCYVHPDITEENYSSWIALDHPYAIVYEACRSIFRQIGWDEQAAQAAREVAEQFAILKQEVTAGGF